MRERRVVCVCLLVVGLLDVPAVVGFCCGLDTNNSDCEDCSGFTCCATGPCNIFCCNCDGCCRNNKCLCSPGSFNAVRNSSHAHYVTHLADTDKDGRMSLKEAMAYLGQSHGASYIRLLQEEISYLDKNNDGYLSAFEID